MKGFSGRVTVVIGDRALPVGTLNFDARAGRETSAFRYGEAWLNSPEAFPLSLHRKRRPMVSMPGHCLDQSPTHVPMPGEEEFWPTIPRDSVAR